MKIESIRISGFKNEEHYQFFCDFKVAVAKYTPAALNIIDEYQMFVKAFNDEDEAFKKITKSPITEQLEVADAHRDKLYRGMQKTVEAALCSFDPDVEHHAKILQIVFDTYGNVPKKSYNQETAAIKNIIQDLEGEYKPSCDIINLTVWLSHVKAANSQFDALMHGRYEELSQKTYLVMKETRLVVDEHYRTIVEKINALWVIYKLNPTTIAAFTNFIKYFNQIIDKYNLIMAQRK